MTVYFGPLSMDFGCVAVLEAAQTQVTIVTTLLAGQMSTMGPQRYTQTQVVGNLVKITTSKIWPLLLAPTVGPSGTVDGRPSLQHMA